MVEGRRVREKTTGFFQATHDQGDKVTDTQRKIVIFLLAGAILTFTIWQLVFVPLFNHQKKLGMTIALNTNRLKQLLTYEQKLKLLSPATRNVTRKKKLPPGFTLFSYLDNLATQNNIKQNMNFLRPSSRQISENVSLEIVDLRLEGVRLGKLMPFLARIESSEYAIFIDRLTIRTRNEPGLLDVDLTCSIVRKGK